MSNGQRLDQLPGTEAALRGGMLSGPKVTELTGAGVLAPEREAELLAGAGEAPLQAVRERCRRSRATSGARDPLAGVRRIRAARHFSSWTDAEGAFCYQGRDTPDRGAQILTHLSHVATRLRRSRRAGGDEDTGPERAVRADAFYALITRRHPDTGAPLSPRSRPTPGPGPGRPPDPVREGEGEGDEVTISEPGGDATATRDAVDPTATTDGRPPDDPSSLIDGPPTCSVMVRVDLDALLRGHAEGDECCEIDDQGPIPVPMARDMANDSFLRLVFHRSGDIRAVSHLGRTINQQLRTALVFRDRTCVVPGCGTSSGSRSITSSPSPRADRPPSTIWPCSATTTTSSRPTRDGSSQRTGSDPRAHSDGDSNPYRPSGRNRTSGGTPTRPGAGGHGTDGTSEPARSRPGGGGGHFRRSRDRPGPR